MDPLCASQTYNCNWFAVKLNGTRPTADSTDFLVEVEQIPGASSAAGGGGLSQPRLTLLAFSATGLMQSADLTSELVDAGYIASYNIPRFKVLACARWHPRAQPLT